jgi:hypothetical protein
MPLSNPNDLPASVQELSNKVDALTAQVTQLGQTILASPSRGETEASRRTSDSFSRAIAIGFLIGFFVAIGTAIVGYFFNIADDRRQREIAFADQQVERLYGPLFALSKATLQAKDVLFADRNRKTGSTDYFDPRVPPTAEDVEKWRLWIKTILQPMNVMMEEAIIKNAQLIEGGNIYTPFAELILHVESYKATMAKWKDTDAKENAQFKEGTENTAVIAFPKKFDQCVEKAFNAMRAKRERLKNSLIPPFGTIEDSSFVAHC